MTLQESQAKYINSKNEVDNIEKKISLKQRQINRLEIKKSKIRENNWWGETLVNPVVELIKAKFPQTTDWDNGKPVAMGLKCRVSVFGKYKGETIGITFCPNDLDKGLISFENGLKGISPVRDLNGFCYKDDVISDIEQVYEYIQKQLIVIHNA